jgi:hypothetical protein
MTKSTPAKLAYQKAYNARPENVEKRVANNAARREAMDKGLVRKGDGKDIAHKKALDNGGTNAPSNLAVDSAHHNRGWRRGQSGYNPDGGKK